MGTYKGPLLESGGAGGSHGVNGVVRAVTPGETVSNHSNESDNSEIISHSRHAATSISSVAYLFNPIFYLWGKLLTRCEYNSTSNAEGSNAPQSHQPRSFLLRFLLPPTSRHPTPQAPSCPTNHRLQQPLPCQQPAPPAFFNYLRLRTWRRSHLI